MILASTPDCLETPPFALSNVTLTLSELDLHQRLLVGFLQIGWSSFESTVSVRETACMNGNVSLCTPPANNTVRIPAGESVRPIDSFTLQELKHGRDLFADVRFCPLPSIACDTSRNLLR